MSHYILLERITVENANAIAGVTYGFPAITQFLGFTHSLSRQLKDEGLTFDGCAIICHDYRVDIYPRYRDYYFVQKKTSPSALLNNRSKAHETPPIIEEGKMDMTISILLRSNSSFGHEEQQKSYRQKVREQLFQSRLAGGSIFACKGIHFYSADSDINHVKRRLLPGFVLMDATGVLKKHIDLSNETEKKELFDCWADFFAYRAKASQENNEVMDSLEAKGKQSKKSPKVEWQQLAKPAVGWFVPLMIGYKGISHLYDANNVANLRDQRYPFRFVESVHSIGEWKGAHKINSLEEIIWRYDVQDEWYLCTQEQKKLEKVELTEETHNVFDGLF